MNLLFTPFSRSGPPSWPDFFADVPLGFRQRRIHSVGVQWPSRFAKGFTLVELLVVMAILLILLGLAVPIVGAIKGGRDIASAAYDVSGAVQAARTYAITHNTYTWVGFYEEASSSFTATNAQPAYKGVGRVLIAVVASIDGTTIVDDGVVTRITLDPTRIAPVGKLLKIEGVHLAEINRPPASPAPNLSADSLDVRSEIPYTADSFSRITSDGAEGGNTTSRPFVAQGYTFYKTIRFNPRGEAVIQIEQQPTVFRRVAEIGLRPARGTAVDTVTPNVIAIQLTGVSGSLKIYRR